jgi:pimeloyl-ACP methyl ester carboxylesterase
VLSLRSHSGEIGAFATQKEFFLCPYAIPLQANADCNQVVGMSDCIFERNETVLLLHGFGGHWLLMTPLARRLRQVGYGVVNWGYRSLFQDIVRHAEQLRSQLESLDMQSDGRPWHIVAHSMGALVTRQALSHYRPTNLRRIVLLCPPNRGSHVASLYSRPLGWLSAPLVQLSDKPGSFSSQLPTNLADQYEVGIIAAQTDFVVRRESIQLPSVSEIAIVPGYHSSMLFGRLTANLTINFLTTGQFESDRR